MVLADDGESMAGSLKGSPDKWYSRLHPFVSTRTTSSRLHPFVSTPHSPLTFAVICLNPKSKHIDSIFCTSASCLHAPPFPCSSVPLLLMLLDPTFPCSSVPLLRRSLAPPCLDPHAPRSHFPLFCTSYPLWLAGERQ